MTLDVFVCRRSRNEPKPCCADNLTENEFLQLQEKAAESGAHVIPRGCLSLCPNKGYAFSINRERAVAKDLNDFEEKIEAYKKAKVLKSSDGYSNRR